MKNTFADFSVGVDIESIKRFKKFKKNSPFLKKVFTKNELEYCFSKANPAQHLAAGFAGKEAVIKSVGGKGVTCQDVEITHESSGAPSVTISKKRFDNARIRISLSHGKNDAIAFVILVI